MGMFDFWWNTVQESKISDVEDEIKLLRKDVSTLKEWVDYLNEKIERLENERRI